MSTARDHGTLDFEPAEDEVKETEDMAEEVGVNVQLLQLSDVEASSLELEKVAVSSPAPLGAVGLPVAPPGSYS